MSGPQLLAADVTTARCSECRCDPHLCDTDDTGQHCEDQSCPTCLHGCPLDYCEPGGGHQ